MYTERNFRTKKALKEAIAKGEKVYVFQPNDMFGVTQAVRQAAFKQVSIEGPHYPEPHRWYARVDLEYGRIVKVR